MSLKLINQNGKIDLQYQVIIESKGELVSLSIYIYPPGGSAPKFLDLVSGTEGQTYAAKLTSAFLKAEDKWGIKLTEIDIDLKVA